MIGFCPECEKTTELSVANTIEEFNIRGEKILVNVTLLKCEEHGHLFDDPESDDDPLDRAYREFRIKEGLLQPEEIKQMRLSYSLTQRELSSLLGWGGATLSRYENGALQSESHDKLLRLAMEPDNLIELIKVGMEKLSRETSKRLMTQLRDRLRQEQPPFNTIMEKLIAQYEPDELSGYLDFDLDKLLDAILFLCSGSDVFKTKLNKLLFYSDFKHHKEYSVSITGARYAHLPFGPAPNHYDLILTMFQEGKKIVLVEKVQQEYVGEIVVALEQPNVSHFSSSEIKTLAQVREYFEGYSSKQISELSHREHGYRETKDGDLISYNFAESLSI